MGRVTNTANGQGYKYCKWAWLQILKMGRVTNTEIGQRYKYLKWVGL
jgi:hypothetical protein